MKLLDWVLVTQTSLCDEKKYIVPGYKTDLLVNRSLAVTEKGCLSYARTGCVLWSISRFDRTLPIIRLQNDRSSP